MIYKHEIDNLTDEEKGALLYALNEVFKTSVKVDLDTVTSYKRDALHAKLRAAKKRLKSEHTEFYAMMCGKLGIDV